MYRRQFNLLVVEEDALALYETVALLKQRDYVLFGAPGAETGAWMLSHWPIDLLVAGVRLRGMNGLQFLAAARSQHPALVGILVGNDGDQVLEAEASRHDATVLVRPVPPALFLTVVAEKLAAIRRRQRWPRKSLGTDMPVSVDGSPARLVDVSYGGLRLALYHDRFDLSSTMTIAVPAAGLQVRAHPVWSSRAGDGVTCLCGAALAEGFPTADWRRFVDQIPQAA